MHASSRSPIPHPNIKRNLALTRNLNCHLNSKQMDIPDAHGRNANTDTGTHAHTNPCSQLNSEDAVIIDTPARNILVEQAKRCLAWAHDPDRAAVPGAENMTKDQVMRQGGYQS
mgnify:CR=1 FL=1